MPEELFDYIVVGAGAAGCVLANRLTEDAGVRVLLLEAGGRDDTMEVRIPAAFNKLFKTARDWAYETTPQAGCADRRLFWPRGKMLGGSTSLNAQMYVRGHRADYDAWAAGGARGWGFDDVRPYFDRAEKTLSIQRLRDTNPTTHAFLEAARACGLPAPAGRHDGGEEGVGHTLVTQRRGRRWSAADAYLRPALKRRNLTVLTGAQAARVFVEQRRAAGVAYVHDGGTRTARARREVILAAGALNSPHLLMVSGIGPAAALTALGIAVVHDLPGGGENLQDHLAAAVVVGCPQPVSLVAAESVANLVRFLLLRRGMLTSNVAEACAFLKTRAELPAPDLEMIFAPVPFIDHGFVKPSGHGTTIGAVLLQPRSRGAVTLRSADPLVLPDVDPRSLSDAGGDDVRTLIAGVHLARRMFGASPFRRYCGEEIEPGDGVKTDREIEAFVRAQAETLYHPVGTCRMGSGRDAVVAPDLRVHGVEALRVVDASVMPTIIRGHTMAPTIMIAEKAADLIRGRAAA